MVQGSRRHVPPRARACRNVGRTAGYQRSISVRCNLPDTICLGTGDPEGTGVPNLVAGDTLSQAGIGSLTWISGPVVKARVAGPLSVLEQVQVGEARLAGEVIALGHDIATIQV